MNGQCCYEVVPTGCATGRPFLVDGAARTAAVAADGKDRGWADPCGSEPSLDGLSRAEREMLASAWLLDAVGEHASVASFARLSLELLACGAPAELVAAAHAAAVDEVNHARLCFALAGAYAGRAAAPSAFPLEGGVAVDSELAVIAANAVKEGCVGETLAAIGAAARLARATDPAVRRALAVIAEDEARHAELAWRTVAWAIRVGGDRVRAAVAEAFVATPVGPAMEHAPARSAALEAHGHPDARTLHEALTQGFADVILPCARALIARSGADVTVRGPAAAEA